MNIKDKLKIVIGAGLLSIIIGIGGTAFGNLTKENKDYDWIRYTSGALLMGGICTVGYASRYFTKDLREKYLRSIEKTIKDSEIKP